MLLSEFFDQLTLGELAQVSIGGKPKGEISQSDYPTIIGHINLGLTRLHTRFLIREDELFIQQYDHIAEYVLDPKYAQTNTGSAEPYKYIADTVANPFLDNVLRIERVYDENGAEVPLNDSQVENSVYTPNYRTIQIPTANSNNSISVVYRGNHPKIDRYTIDLSAVSIELPPSFYEALLYFVASRVHAPMGPTELGSESNNYFMKYEAACQTLERYNMLHEDNETNTRLEMNGWV